MSADTDRKAARRSHASGNESECASRNFEGQIIPNLGLVREDPPDVLKACSALSQMLGCEANNIFAIAAMMGAAH